MSKEAKFTPGPWVATDTTEGHYCVAMGSKLESNFCWEPKHQWFVEWTAEEAEEEGDNESQANAHLMAAAPDGYTFAELVASICNLRTMPTEQEVKQMGEEAIKFMAKARGES